MLRGENVISDSIRFRGKIYQNAWAVALMLEVGG